MYIYMSIVHFIDEIDRSLLMDFHIDFIESRYLLTSGELRCLSKALGYPTSALMTIFSLPPNGSIEKMISLMEKPNFDVHMNQSFNIYTSSWNNHLIMTSILLLGHRSISFKELNMMRCVFHFYEEDDGKGLELDTNKLLHHIKMCGRIIAPMKLTHRLKHMKHRLYERCRMQLWEFLELNIWSDVQAFITELLNQRTTYKSDKSNIYDISDIEKDLSIIYTDVEAWENENVRYIKEEWTLPVGNFKKILRLIYKPLKTKTNFELRKKLIERSNYLKGKVVQSNHDISIANGTCFKFNSRSNSKLISETQKNEETNNLSFKNKKLLENLLVGKFSKRPKTAPIVTTEDYEVSRNLIEESKNYLLKMPEKYKERIRLDMEYLKPGFWTRWESRPSKHFSQLTHVNLELKRIPSREHIERISKSASKSSKTFHESCIELM